MAAVQREVAQVQGALPEFPEFLAELTGRH